MVFGAPNDLAASFCPQLGELSVLMGKSAKASIPSVILCGILVCVLADGCFLILTDADALTLFGPVIWASAIWASIVSTVGVLAFFVLWRVGQAIGGLVSRPRFFGAVVPAIPLGYLLFVLVDDLLGGQGFAVMARAKEIRWIVTWTAAVSPLILIWVIMVSHDRLRRKKNSLFGVLETVGFLGFVVVCCFVDGSVYPRLYRSAHILIWLAILSAVFIWRIRLEIRLDKTEGARIRNIKVGLIVALIAMSVLADPLSNRSARRAAWGDTLFLKRALMTIVPSRQREVIDVDPEILASLSKVKTIHPRDLDRVLPNRRHMNIVLVSVDALRADRQGRWNYQRNLTPNIDALASKSTDFSEAWTCCPATLPSFSATLRSNLWMHNDVYKDRHHIVVEPGHRQAVLPKELQTLGFETEAILGVRHSFVVARLAPGFDRFNAEGRDSSQNAERVTDFGLAALDHFDDAPFFLWLHYFDPHTPYDGYGRRHFGNKSVDKYDSEVAYVDRELGRFLEGLRSRGLEQDTVIVFLADHGEEWDKNGNARHANDVDAAQIHIPLLIHVPGIKAHRVSSAVSNIDIMPTILELLGAEVPDSCAGRSLLRFVLFGQPRRGEEATYPAPIAFSESFEGTRRIAARRGNMKITYDVEADVYTLYRISVDSAGRKVEMVEDEDTLLQLKKLLTAFESAGAN